MAPIDFARVVSGRWRLGGMVCMEDVDIGLALWGRTGEVVEVRTCDDCANGYHDKRPLAAGERCGCVCHK